MGRRGPQANPATVRKVVSVKMNPTEKALAARAADLEGKELSTWIREAALMVSQVRIEREEK